MKRLHALVFAALLAASPAYARPHSSAEAHQQFMFGIEMAQKGSWREAAFRFERSIREDPNNSLAQNNLGVARESIGDFDGALKSYQRAAELDPKNSKIRENLDRLQAYLATRNAPAPPAAQSAPHAESQTQPGGGHVP